MHANYGRFLVEKQNQKYHLYTYIHAHTHNRPCLDLRPGLKGHNPSLVDMVHGEPQAHHTTGPRFMDRDRSIVRAALHSSPCVRSK